jgi:tRNASer (uridine44-2'-O)-methyltransferase
MDGSELDSDRAESMSDFKDDMAAKSASSHDLANMGGRKGDKFDPFDLQKEPKLDSGLPPELWTIIQAAPANFTPQYFLEVSRNLLENPNLTASHLARAELFYSSFTDATFNPEATHPHELAGIIKHMKADHQPLLLSGGVREYKLEWTVVRKLIPRNPKLDQPLIQSCHLYASTNTVVVTSLEGNTHQIEADRYMVVYLPHVTSPDTIPFYHPKVRALAILYAYHPNAPASSYSGTLSLYYNLFPSYPLDNRLSRTALKMLDIIHKHSRGRQAGYTKRVHHDQIIPQKRFQDTYAHLKGKYAKPLIDNWVEQTPASKHVFEDLGIAAFLIELWTDMYGGKNRGVPSSTNAVSENTENEFEEEWRTKARQNFPGFVDIGCGNGLLVYILNQEGWDGWGFDARRRKTWDTFAPTASFSLDKLKEMLLVPEVLNTNNDTDLETIVPGTDGTIEGMDVSSPRPATHNGIFPSSTFIISNHADELTAWTPMLAFLSESPFIAIPCCSHNFGGTRFRAPDRSAKRSSKKAAPSASLTSTSQADIDGDASTTLCASSSTASEAPSDPGPSTPSITPPALKPPH